jgi:predicted PolB exonuclease-like 3'-5' exonuclease
MDVLAGHQARANASLQDVSVLLGFPGKLGMHGSRVWDHYLEGDVESIRNYCETDALNTFLIYLRFELMRGRLSDDAYRGECENLRSTLAKEAKPHLDEFLNAWPGADPA